MIKIDKNISTPYIDLRGRPAKYPWLELEVGDSLLLDVTNPHSAACMVHTAGKKYNCKFTCRKTDEGYRVWRIA